MNAIEAAETKPEKTIDQLNSDDDQLLLSFASKSRNTGFKHLHALNLHQCICFRGPSHTHALIVIYGFRGILPNLKCTLSTSLNTSYMTMKIPGPDTRS